MPGLRILIVGAGLGGLALASFLDECEIEYSIIERCPEWSHAGYALGLWNNGRHILRKLGVADYVDKNEIAFQSVLICDGKGNKLRSYNLGNFIRNLVWRIRIFVAPRFMSGCLDALRVAFAWEHR
jgi:FAD-dependent urate hydroxylase